MTEAMDMTGVPDTDRGPWMQTFMGGKFYPLDPDPMDIDPRDISIGLSNICRYVGQVAVFYSVAQHCVIAADKAEHEHGDVELARIMLLHDAAEAYLGDMSRPLKSVIPAYREIEHKTWLAIADRFAVPREMPPAVKQIDNELLAIEKETLQPNAEDWPGVAKATDRLCIVWSPSNAQAAWWKKFTELFPWDPVLKPKH